MHFRHRGIRPLGPVAILVLVLGALVLWQQPWRILQSDGAGEHRLLYAKAVKDPTLSGAPVYRWYEIYQVGPGTGARAEYLFSILDVSPAPAPAGRVFLLRKSEQVLANLGTLLATFDIATSWSFRVEFPVWGMKENGPGKRRVWYTAPEGYSIYGMALSHDEQFLSFTEYRQRTGAPPEYHIKRLSLEDGTVADLWTSDQGTLGFRGVPVPLVWVNSGDALLLQGITFSGNCCSYGRINADGSGFTAVDLPYGLPSPDGAWFASNGHTGSGTGCYQPRREVLLYDLATLGPTVVFTDPERVVEVRGWLHDSMAFLFSASDLGPAQRPDCGPEPDPASTRYYLADPASRAVQEIAKDDERVAMGRFPGAVEGVVVRCADPNYAAWLCTDATLVLTEVVLNQDDGIWWRRSGGTFRGDLVGRNVEVDRGGPFAVLGWLP